MITITMPEWFAWFIVLLGALTTIRWIIEAYLLYLRKKIGYTRRKKDLHLDGR